MGFLDFAVLIGSWLCVLPRFGEASRENPIFSPSHDAELPPNTTPSPAPPPHVTERPIPVVETAKLNTDLKSFIFTYNLLSVHLLVKRCCMCRYDKPSLSPLSHRCVGGGKHRWASYNLLCLVRSKRPELVPFPSPDSDTKLIPKDLCHICSVFLSYLHFCLLFNTMLGVWVRCENKEWWGNAILIPLSWIPTFNRSHPGNLVQPQTLSLKLNSKKPGEGDLSTSLPLLRVSDSV